MKYFNILLQILLVIYSVLNYRTLGTYEIITLIGHFTFYYFSLFILKRNFFNVLIAGMIIGVAIEWVNEPFRDYNINIYLWRDISLFMIIGWGYSTVFFVLISTWIYNKLFNNKSKRIDVRIVLCDVVVGVAYFAIKEIVEIQVLNIWNFTDAINWASLIPIVNYPADSIFSSIAYSIIMSAFIRNADTLFSSSNILSFNNEKEDVDKMNNSDKHKHVFISYVHEDIKKVTQLSDVLKKNGIEVWLDKNNLYPGIDWKIAIENAINNGAYFIACFSVNYYKKSKSYMNEELQIAIDQLRQMRDDRIWFIPVKLSDCNLPTLSIRQGKDLSSKQWVDLYNNWSEGVYKIVETINK